MRFDEQTVSQAAHLAEEGSPLFVSAVGRLVGLGAPERAQLAQGKVPGWVWMTAGLAAGVVAGVQLQKRFPDQMRVVGGGRR